MFYNLMISYNNFLENIKFLAPQLIWALLILWSWVLLSIICYYFIKYLFVKLKVNELLSKFQNNSEEEDNDKVKEKTKQKKWAKELAENIKIDELIAKSIWVYIFLLFLRMSVSYIWINEVEKFLNDVTSYLPSLFIWVLIWFFGIRFSNSIYNIIYTTINISKTVHDEKTTKILAYSWKIIILFFTLMVFLDYTKIVSDFIVNTVIIWFVFMVSLAWWLSFWLGWKESAKEIIDNLKK